MDKFVTFVKNKKGLMIGIGMGLLVGILILTINFWRTLLLAVCVGVGAFFGSQSRLKDKFLAFLDKILPHGNK